MNHELLQAQLDLIAARAKLLAEDFRRDRLWGGDLSKGISEIEETIRKMDTRTDR